MDEVTGLQAFEDLDPVSTVSALNPAPETVPPEPRRSFPPPPRGGAGGRSLARPSGGPPVPPGPRRTASGRSLPPPPPRAVARSLPPPPPGLAPDADTKVVPNDFAEDPYAADTMSGPRPVGEDQFESYEDPRPAPLRDLPVRAGIDDTELLELSATTVATELDMDWEDDQLDTRLRDDAPQSYDEAPGRGPGPNGSHGIPSPFPQAPAGGASSYANGNPSPFGPVPSQPPPPPPSFAPPATTDEEWEDEEEAATRVMGSPLSEPVPPPPTIHPDYAYQPAPFPTAPQEAAAPAQTVEWPEQPGPDRVRQAAVGLAALAVIGIAIGVRSLMGGPDNGTVTLVTTPADAKVAVDGRPLVDQTSPFTVQGLAPGVDHHIEVTKEGFKTFEISFALEGGEVRSLEPVALDSAGVETGFALNSKPSGAVIYVDDTELEEVTPARVVDLEPGLHTIRLERGHSYQPWQTQVEFMQGQVIELPVAVLVANGSRGREAEAGGRRTARAERRAASSSSRSKRSSAPKAERKASSKPRRTAAASRSPSRKPPSGSPRFVSAPSAPAPSGGGKTGTLRINSRPWAQVFVDGRLIGNTPQMAIPLSAGRHKVRLVNKQMGMSKQLSVRVKAGKSTTKIVNLVE